MRILLILLIVASVAVAEEEKEPVVGMDVPDLIFGDGKFSDHYKIEGFAARPPRFPFVCHDDYELLAFEGGEKCSLNLSKRLADDLVKELERHGYEIKKKKEKR